MTEFNQNFIAALNRKTQKTPPIWIMRQAGRYLPEYRNCLLYTSPSPRDAESSRMPSSA